jgi:hypothetical protein
MRKSMKLTRRDLLAWGGGAAAGIIVTPVPWNLLNDVTIRTQNWPGVPQPARGPVDTQCSFCTLCPQGCAIRIRMAAGWPVGIAPHGGALCPLAFAAQQLNWHPRRLRQVLHHGQPATWSEARAAFRRACTQGALAIIDGRPRRAASAIFEQFAKTHEAAYRVVLSAEERSLLPCARMTGVPASALGYDLENARTVISFGVPLLDGWGAPSRFPRLWSENPDLRLIQIEPRLSRTANAAWRWLPTADRKSLEALALEHPPAVAIALDDDPDAAALNLAIGAIGARGGIIRRRQHAASYESAGNLPEDFQAIVLDSTVPWNYTPPANAETFRFAAWQGDGQGADWLLPAPGFLEELTDIPTAPAAARETYAIAAKLVPPPVEVHTAAEFLRGLDPTLPSIEEIIRHRCRELFKTQTSEFESPEKLEAALRQGAVWTGERRSYPLLVHNPPPAAGVTHHPPPVSHNPAWPVQPPLAAKLYQESTLWRPV